MIQWVRLTPSVLSSRSGAIHRRVKQAIPAWRTDLPGDLEHIPTGPISPAGEVIVIEPSEEIHVLRWTSVYGDTMALISWRDTLYLVGEDDLEERTIRVFKAGR